MYVHNIDPNILTIGAFSITWYGLVYSVGFLFALMFMVLVAKKKLIGNFNEDDAYDLVFYLIIGSILTARLFYIIFYNPLFYISDPLQVFAFWNGGMSFHGGLVGAVISMYYFSRKKGISFLQISDALVIPAALMLGFGRIANFINAELVGIRTTVSWCVDFGDGLCRHPSQLYEAAKNFFTFGILMALWKNKKKWKIRDGTLFYAFITMYGFLRFFITFLREADPTDFLIGPTGIAVGQWLSLIMGLVGLYLIIKIYFLSKTS